MKKWLLPTIILLWQTAVLAQQAPAMQPGQEIFNEAFRYLNGLGKSHDPAKAIQLFKEAAALGNGASLNALGNLYAKGEAGLSADITTAIEFYKQAGKAGYGAGYYNLATLYRDDKVLPQDFRKSAQYTREGAGMGDASCKNLLAYYFFKGFGVTQSYSKAFSLYQELAQSEDVNAKYFLGLCYRNGYGTVANQDEAKRWLQLAADQGDRQAIHELTREPEPENSSIKSPVLQQQVQKLRNYEEKLIAASSNDISGVYRGFAVYFDFSGYFVHEIVPLSLTLHKGLNSYEGVWTEDNSLDATVKGSFNNNNFNFDPSSQYTRRNYYSYRDAEKYQFKSARLSVKYIKDSVYLAGDMQFYSLGRKEPGQPMYIVLSKKVKEEGGSTGNLQLAINPNPVTTELKATFTLNKSAKVSFNITGADGKTFMKQADEALLPPGTYSIPINVQRLVNGSYALRIITSTGATQTKLFIKL